MAVDDLWYLRRPDAVTGARIPSQRHGRGKRWRVRYADDSGHPVTRLFDRKPDAQHYEAETRTDIARGVYIDPAAGKVTVERYAATWRASKLHRDSTSSLVERAFRLHIVPVIGGMAIASVRASHVQSMVTGWSSTMAASSARLIYSHVVAMFHAAVRDRAIALTPCVGIELPELPRGEHLILTPQQVHALAEALPAECRAMVYLGAGCGLRPSEVFGLELGHVDLARREIHVVQQLRTATGRPPFLAPLKTRTSHRTVELPRVTADAIAKHLVTSGGVTGVQVTDATTRTPRERTAELLFTITGAPISRSVWSKLWAPAARTVGLPAGTGFHALRHYFATLLIFSGANVKTVQLALGHSTPIITLNTYVGLWPDQLDRTRNLVDDALGAS
jgi:integrase